MKFIETLKERKFRLSLNQKEYTPLKLKGFFILEDLKIKLIEILKSRKKLEFRRILFEIIKLQTGETVDIRKTSYLDVLRSTLEILNQNHLQSDAVFLRPPPTTENKKEGAKKDRWDFDGRALAQWIDTFARNYGWSLEEILNLDINFASYVFQEILVNEQFEKEWEYGLSELAYESVPNSNKMRLKELPRPYWMRNEIDGKLPKTKIRKDMLPDGVIIDLSGMGVMKNDREN